MHVPGSSSTSLQLLTVGLGHCLHVACSANELKQRSEVCCVAQKLEQAFGGDGLSADDRFLKLYLLNQVGAACTLPAAILVSWFKTAACLVMTRQPG